MGQTLTHGVYLPDEGERNCYAGLAANWQILDTSVGTVAEHTTQIAGKAPLVHTHTKANITDLLNSNFIPSANNSYDLGSSSYQWNNVYSKKYYYNGVAWGLDKANTWSQSQTISYTGTNVQFALKHTETDISSSPTRNNWFYLNFYDANSITVGGYNYSKRTNGNARLYLNLRTKNTNNDIVEKNIHFETNQGGTVWNLYPSSDADIGLGMSSARWKTLNGINPGALSLPDTLGTSGTENVNYFNVIGYLNNTGTLATIPTTATYDGWLYINAKDGADSYIIVDDSPSSFGTSVFGNNGLGAQSIGLLCLMCPIRKGHFYNVRIKSAGIVSARIYPAQGNV